MKHIKGIYQLNEDLFGAPSRIIKYEDDDLFNKLVKHLLYLHDHPEPNYKPFWELKETTEQKNKKNFYKTTLSISQRYGEGFGSEQHCTSFAISKYDPELKTILDFNVPDTFYEVIIIAPPYRESNKLDVSQENLKIAFDKILKAYNNRRDIDNITKQRAHIKGTLANATKRVAGKFGM